MKFTVLHMVLCVALASCSRPTAPTPTSQTASAARLFETKGVIRGKPAPDTLQVEHEDIPGFMPSMTMPFRTTGSTAELKVGDAIAFDLLVTEDGASIERIRKIGLSEVAIKKSATESLPRVTRLHEGDRLSPFQLTDSKGRKITEKTFEGKELLLTFIFTRCPIPNFCPLMSLNFKRLQESIAADPRLSSQTNLLSISFDPEFDTTEMLNAYGSAHTKDQDSWRFATGTPEAVRQITAAFSVYIQTEDNTISHGLCTALVGPDGVIRKIWRGNAWEPQEVLAVLQNRDSEATAQVSTPTNPRFP